MLVMNHEDVPTSFGSFRGNIEVKTPDIGYSDTEMLLAWKFV